MVGSGFVEHKADEYTTLKALRRCATLLYHPNGKALNKYNEELIRALGQEVADLTQTMRAYGVFSSKNNIKRNVDFMKRVRSELGDVFLYSFCVANSLNVDVSKVIYDKIREQERKQSHGLKK